MILQVLITAAFILLFLKFADKDNVIDFFSSVTFYLVPLVIVLVINFVVDYFVLPSVIKLLSLLLFFVVPYLMINAIYDTYSTKKKFLISTGVFAIVIVAEVTLSVFTLASQNA